MKRDLVLIRKIFDILSVLSYTKIYKPIPINIKGASKEKVDYHIKLLKDFEMIETMIDDKGQELPCRIMWRGHEYLQEKNNSILTLFTKHFS